MNPYIPCKYVQNPYYISVQRIIYLHYLSILYLYWSFASCQQQQKYHNEVQYNTVAAVARQIYYKIQAGYMQLLHRQIQRLYIEVESEKEGERKRKRQIDSKRTMANSREPVCMYVYRRARDRKGTKERKEGKKKEYVCV